MTDLPALVEAARERSASAGHAVLASVATPVEASVQLPDAPTACLWIEPGLAMAGAGVAASVEASGPERFSALEKGISNLLDEAVCDGGEPLAFAGAAFAPGGDGWPGLPEALAWVPEIAVMRDADGTRLVAAVLVDADSGVDASERLRALLDAGLPPPQPGGTAAVPYGTYAPSDDEFDAAVAEALEAIEGGNLTKVVLARKMSMRSSSGVSPSALADALAGRYPSCFIYAVRKDAVAFVGASPELLVAREGMTVRATPAAGTVADSAQPSESRRLAGGLDTVKSRWEQELVADAVYDVLEPMCEEISTHLPMVVGAGPVQHLSTSVEGRLSEPVHILELVDALHPTPAVGGVPLDKASEFISSREGFDRGWYAGPIGVVRRGGWGSFAVALRGALVHANELELFAGAGIVEGSIAHEERREIELKLGAVAAVLTPEA